MNTAQLQALKAAILADVAISGLVATNPGAITAYYNNTPVTPFVVWQTAVQTDAIFDAIVWANLTPTDAPDGTLLWNTRSLACQGKQFNLQTILQGRSTINASRANIRQGLHDALTAVPSGVGGVNTAAGWNAVNIAMQRNANRVEALFATGTGTSASPGALIFEGNISDYDIQAALLS